MFSSQALALATMVLEMSREAGIQVSTAESCTGGLIAGCLTAIAGSSDVVDRGFVTYTNEAKNQMLGVPLELFSSVGAVSEEVARAMAEGAIANSSSSLSVSVTGVAGPGGGTETKPVGLVHMAAGRSGRDTLHERHLFPGDRTQVRDATVISALSLLIKSLDQ